MSNFLRREILITFYEVVNYVRNLILAKNFYSYALTTEQYSDLEYYVVQLKLYVLLFDSKLSPEILAKGLNCRRETVTVEKIERVLSTKDKIMSGSLQHRVYFLASIHIEDDMQIFYKRCVEVLSRVTSRNFSNTLGYKTTDGRKKIGQTENQKLLILKSKINMANLEPVV